MADPSATNFTRGTSEVDIDHFNQWMRSQPWWQQLQTTVRDPKQRAKLIEQHLATNGSPLGKDFHVDDAGNINQKSRLKRNLLIGGAIAGAVLGAPALIGAIGGGAGAGAGAAAAGAGAGAGAAGTTAATIGAGLGSSLLKNLVSPSVLSSGIGAGANLIGTKIAANSTDKAAQLQADATQKALDEQKRQYDLYRSDMEPYRTAGAGSIGLLSQFLGLPAQPSSAGAPMTGGMPTQGAPSTSGQMVTLKSPNGQTESVPANRADHYLALGATRV